MSYWAGLDLDFDKEALEVGINTMLQIVMKLAKKKKQSNVYPQQGCNLKLEEKG